MPRTHMQATRTYLELDGESQFKPGFGTFPDLVIERVERPTPEMYRECYRTVGEAYHWRDRWDWTDTEIRAHLAQPEITLHVERAAAPRDVQRDLGLRQVCADLRVGPIPAVAPVVGLADGAVTLAIHLRRRRSEEH